MTQEQQIIQQIEARLASSQLERNEVLEELASQYAELCETVNARLTRCLDFLDSGMRSEAVNEAANPPDLNSLLAALQFEGANKWNNLCLDLELPVAPPLNEAGAKRLMEAVAVERNLEPLLREYRRSVYVGDHAASIVLLRQIREKDPLNPSWSVNLKPLEEEMMPQLVNAVDEAIRKNDRTELQRLYKEITHPQRASEVPADLMRKIKTVLLSERAADLKLKASNLLNRLHAAVNAEDVTETEKLLENASSIASDEAFIEVPEQWNSSLSAAREMLDLQARRAEKRSIFLKEVEALQNQLNAGSINEIMLRHAWEHVESWQLPVSDALRHQVEATLADMQASRLRKKRIVTFSIVGVIVLVIGIAGTLYGVNMQRNRRAGCLNHARAMLDEGKYNELLLYVKELSRTDEILVGSSQMQELQRKAQEAIKHQEELLSSFDAAYDELETIRRRGYGSAMPERVSQLLDEARNLASELKDNVRLSRVKTWRKAYEEWNDRRIHDASSEIGQLVAAIKSALNEAKNRPYASIDDELAKIAALNARREEVQHNLSNAGELDKKNFAEMVESLQAWEREANERAEKQKKLTDEIARLKEDILHALPDLVRYRTLMQRYVELAPKTDMLARDYRRLLGQFDLYLSVPALNTFKLAQLPPTADECEKIGMFLSGNIKGTIWEEALTTVLNMAKAHELINAEILNMSNDTPELSNFYYIKYREKGGQTWKRLYSPDMLKISADSANPGRVNVFGKIFYAANADDAVTVVHTKEIFGANKLNSDNYDFEYERKKDDNLSEYGRFVQHLSIASSDVQDMVDFLLQSLQKLQKNQEMELVPKAVAFKRISSMLKKYYGSIVPEFNDLAQQWESIDVTVPWRNEKNPRTIAENARIENLLNASPDWGQLKSIYKARCEEYIKKINGVYVCAGVIVMVDGLPEIRQIGTVKAGTQLESIISSPTPRLITVSEDARHISSDAREYVINGMPLFICR